MTSCVYVAYASETSTVVRNLWLLLLWLFLVSMTSAFLASSLVMTSRLLWSAYVISSCVVVCRPMNYLTLSRAVKVVVVVAMTTVVNNGRQVHVWCEINVHEPGQLSGSVANSVATMTVRPTGVHSTRHHLQ